MSDYEPHRPENPSLPWTRGIGCSLTNEQQQEKNVVSVKGGCIDGLDWKNAIHIWTKSAMVPIPEGSETHSEESECTDYGESQEALDQPVNLRGNGGSIPSQDPVRGACELSG